MAEQMVEYATYAVLRCYREFAAYEKAQAAARWEPRPRLDKAAFGIGCWDGGLGYSSRAGARHLWLSRDVLESHAQRACGRDKFHDR